MPKKVNSAVTCCFVVYCSIAVPFYIFGCYLQVDFSGGRMLVWDFIIALAYFAIPLELLYCFLWYPFPVRAKPAIFCSLFVCFITICGGTHLARAFDFTTAVPIVTAICTVISVLTAFMLLWLIPGVFKLAKALEQERVERLMLENFQGTLTEAAEGPDDIKATLNIIRAVPHCSNRQLRLLTAAKSSLCRMLASNHVDIVGKEGLKEVPGKVTVPINQLFVIVLDKDVHAKHRDILAKLSGQIAHAFMEAGDLILE